MAVSWVTAHLPVQQVAFCNIGSACRVDSGKRLQITNQSLELTHHEVCFANFDDALGSANSNDALAASALMR